MLIFSLLSKIVEVFKEITFKLLLKLKTYVADDARLEGRL